MNSSISSLFNHTPKSISYSEETVIALERDTLCSKYQILAAQSFHLNNLREKNRFRAPATKPCRLTTAASSIDSGASMYKKLESLNSIELLELRDYLIVSPNMKSDSSQIFEFGKVSRINNHVTELSAM